MKIREDRESKREGCNRIIIITDQKTLHTSDLIHYPAIDS